MSSRKSDFCSCTRCGKIGHAAIRGLGSDSLARLDRVRCKRVVAAGDKIFSQGDPLSGLHCIDEGLLALKALNADGMNVLIGLARHGDMIGYASFLSDTAHKVTAEALVPTRLCTIPAGAARALMLSDAQFAGMLAQCCLREAKAHRARMIAFSGRSNEVRLSMILAALLAASGMNGPSARLDLPLSRADLASVLSIAPETLSRVLARLKSKGIVWLEGRELIVPSLARLSQIADNHDAAALAGFMATSERGDVPGDAAAAS